MNTPVPGWRRWLDARLPGVAEAWRRHVGGYFVPRTLNVWYCFGALALLALAGQLLTGLFLTMHYVPTAEGAFASVQRIMRDVDGGWLIRYLHAAGASLFFAVIYLHMARGLMYGSYRRPRELVWLLGVLLYFVVAAEAFMGYVLPWGQMSFWGAKVIISLFGAIPVIGNGLTEWIMGDYLPGDATLNRFFALHVIALPLVLLLLVVLHLGALHEVGSNNPDGIEFHPYYTVKDIVGVVVFLFIFCTVIFFFPEMGGYFLEKPNFEMANQFKTPEHIAPVWYFTPFYAILRAVPDKLMGVIAMGAAIAVLFVLPWLDRSPVRSIRYKGWLSKLWLVIFAVSFVILGYYGAQAPSPLGTTLSRVCTVLYFAFFILMPFYTRMEKTKPVPERVTG